MSRCVCKSFVSLRLCILTDSVSRETRKNYFWNQVPEWMQNGRLMLSCGKTPSFKKMRPSNVSSACGSLWHIANMAPFSVICVVASQCYSAAFRPRLATTSFSATLHIFSWSFAKIYRTRLIEYRASPKLINELSARNCDELFTFLAFFWGLTSKLSYLQKMLPGSQSLKLSSVGT